MKSTEGTSALTPEQVVEALLAMDLHERERTLEALFEKVCKYCYSDILPCYCWHDE